MSNSNDLVSGCGICDSIKALSPERTLWEDDHWLAGTMLEVPGWILIMAKRHVDGIWSLSDAEAASLGPMIRDISNIVKEITGAERVHYAAMGEVVLHYHGAILPRLAGQVPVFDSMNLVERARVDANPAAARDLETRLSARLTLNGRTRTADT